MSSILVNAADKCMMVTNAEVVNPYNDGRRVSVTVAVGGDYLCLESLDRYQLVKLIDGLEEAFHVVAGTHELEAQAEALPVGDDGGKKRCMCDRNDANCGRCFPVASGYMP